MHPIHDSKGKNQLLHKNQHSTREAAPTHTSSGQEGAGTWGRRSRGEAGGHRAAQRTPGRRPTWAAAVLGPAPDPTVPAVGCKKKTNETVSKAIRHRKRMKSMRFTKRAHTAISPCYTRCHAPAPKDGSKDQSPIQAQARTK